MATVQSFEELEIWKKAQDLGGMVYELCEINQKIAKDFSFKDQIKRAVLSISNNIAEGFEYSNNNHFIRFLKIAKGSCGEVQNCLLFSLKVKYTTKPEVFNTIEFARLLSKQIGSMIQYLLKIKAANSANNKNP
jgi:four helix bundle protein